MEVAPAVFEISSEDEERVTGGGPTSEGDDNHDWLKEILTELEKEEEEDDVVVVSEVKASVENGLNETNFDYYDDGDDVDDDEDCVVLDGDPDKPVKQANDVKGGVCDYDVDDDDDDVKIVGEKGQIACRDYPHPRHLCIKYPFNSSPHEKHCELCHCYVCDSPAPCLHWNTGLPNIDHCHATDKEEEWIVERKFMKSLNNASQPVSRYPHLNLIPHFQHAPEQSELLHPYQISQFNEVPQTNQLSSQRTVWLGPNNVSLNQVPGQPTIRVCSSQRNVGVSNVTSIANQSRHDQPGFVAAQSRLQLHSVAAQSRLQPHSFAVQSRLQPHLVGVQNRLQPHLVAHGLNGVSVSERDRSRNIGNLSRNIGNSQALFKRPGSIQGTVTRNRVMPRPTINANHAHSLQHRRNNNAVATSGHNNFTGLETLYPCSSSDSIVHQSSQQRVGNSFANTESTQPQFRPEEQNNFQGGALTGNSMLHDSSHVCYQSDRNYAGHGISYQWRNQYQDESALLNSEWQRNFSQSDQLVSDNVDQLQTRQQFTIESQQLQSQSTQQSLSDSFQLHIQSDQQPAVDCLGAHTKSYQKPLSDSLHHQSQSNPQSPLEIYGPVSTQPIYNREPTDLNSHCIDLFDFETSASDSMASGLPAQMNILSPESSMFMDVFNYDFDFSWNDMNPS